MEKEMAIKIAASRSNIEKRTILKYMKQARIHGYDPAISTVIKERYVADVFCSGCSLIATSEVEERILAAGNIKFYNFY